MEDYRLITEWGTYYFICPWCGNKHDNGMEYERCTICNKKLIWEG